MAQTPIIYGESGSLGCRSAGRRCAGGERKLSSSGTAASSDEFSYYVARGERKP